MVGGDSNRYQLGPIRFLPGSPTLAPLVVNATELGCWMELSTIDMPTATIAANNKAARKTLMEFTLEFASAPNYSAGAARGALPDGVWPFACSSSTQSE
jgi:hypothetical protein